MEYMLFFDEDVQSALGQLTAADWTHIKTAIQTIFEITPDEALPTAIYLILCVFRNQDVPEAYELRWAVTIPQQAFQLLDFITEVIVSAG